jgi:Flp pilus assembly protein TadD/DNA-binding transcriptional regulator GbsR (MarR family)
MSDIPSAGEPSSPVKVRLFNPRQLNDAELEHAFIARQATFRSLVDDLVAEPADSRPQHHLIVGQRGMGKTTLLCRVGLELRRDPHRAAFIPLSFPEEQHVEVDRLSKFWLNCLDALADALEAEGGNREAVAAIDAAVQGVERRGVDEKVVEEAAREAFTAAWRGLGRRPVLLIDNFNRLLNRLKEHDYALRGYFSACGAPILVGACTELADRLEDYAAAFYEGFKHHWLRPLSLQEMREVVERLARAAGRQDVLNRVASEGPRMAALRDLTGGNPRTAVLLFDLFTRGVSQDAYGDLESLLDIVTPLYQSRLEQLSEQAQVIVGAMARHWHPLTAAELCDATGLTNSSVSPQLGRLEDFGLVEKAAVFPSKRTGYQIAERFFNVWYLMRFATRRQRSSLASLTRFLETFHTPDERCQVARQMLSETSLRREKIAYALAVADSLSSEGELGHELAVKAQLDLVQQMKGVREAIAEIIDPAEIDPRLYEFAALKEKLREAVPAGASVTGEEFADLVLGSLDLLPGGKDDAPTRQQIAASGLTLDKVEELVATLRGDGKKWERLYTAGAVSWLRKRLQRGLVTSWANGDELSASLLATPDKPAVRLVLNFSPATAKRELTEQAFETIRRCLQPSGNSDARRWFEWAFRLQTEFCRYQKAEQAYRRAIALDPKYAYPWNNLGNLLEDRLGRYAEAEAAYRQAIALDPKYAYPWNGLGNLQQDRLGRYAEAEQAYRQAIALDPKYAYPWNNLGNLLQDHLGRYAEAEAAYRQAIALDPKFAHPWNGLGNLLQDRLGRYAEAEQAYRNAIALDPKSADPWNNLGNVLKNHLGRYAEAEQAYRNAIALDPKLACPSWNGLGNLLTDYLGRFEDGRTAYENAIQVDPTAEAPRQNLAFLLRDLLGDPTAARRVLTEVRESAKTGGTHYLHDALFAAYEGNWGLVTAALRQALQAAGFTLPPWTRDDWFRASAVLLHLGFGEKLVAFLEQEGIDVKMLPWFGAVRAHALGDRRYLLNVAVEARPAAEKIYDEIQMRRERLEMARRNANTPKP